MYYFCTYFDQNYLTRGLALYHSLVRHCAEFKLWVLCMDNLAKRELDKFKLANIITIALEEFESGDEDLLRAKANRSTIEYYFTCTPSLPLYVLKRWAEVDLVTYLDADLYFFNSPELVFQELNGHSIGIIGHNFTEHYKHLERYGIYNVGWLSFRRDSNAMACLSWWRDRCIEWCYDKYENGLFADQKYLDEFPTRFDGVHVIQNKGANVAPWNLAKGNISVSVDDIRIDDSPLIFFHFEGFKRVVWNVYDPNFFAYQVCTSKIPVVKTFILGPYCDALSRADSMIEDCNGLGGKYWGIRTRGRGLKGLVRYQALLVKKLAVGSLYFHR